MAISVIGRLPAECEFALSVTDDEAEMAIYPPDKKTYYYVTTDYRLAPTEMAKVVMKRGILKVTIYPPNCWE